MTEKKCIICGEVFTATRNVRCCSPLCSAENRRQQRLLRKLRRGDKGAKKCVVCGKMFTGTPNSITCSAECKRIRKKQKNEEYCVRNVELYGVRSKPSARELEKRRIKEKDGRLDENVRRAREAGMSYGQYKAMKYMKDMQTGGFRGAQID